MLRVGALFMEAGSGKTKAAMELIKSASPDFVLWLTPFQTKENLTAEIRKQGGQNCRIEGIESLSSSDSIYIELRNILEKSNRAFIVCDESLKIKNSNAIRTKRILDLGKLAAFRLVLNGTPLSRNLLDLWSQMEFLSPKILNMSESAFKNTFCEYVTVIHKSPENGRTYSREFIKRYHNLPYLHSLIEPYVFESKLSISVGVQHHDLLFSLTDEEMDHHNLLKEKYLDNEVLMLRRNNIFLELTQKMQHNYSLSPQKFDLLNQILKSVDRSKVLIFVKYVDTRVALEKAYPNIKILSYGKHSFGLNLQQFSHTIFWDKTWDYAQREQVEHRTYRTGQQSDCIYYDFTSNAGLDKLINQNIAKKSTLLSQFKMLSNEQLKEML